MLKFIISYLWRLLSWGVMLYPSTRVQKEEVKTKVRPFSNNIESRLRHAKGLSVTFVLKSCFLSGRRVVVITQNVDELHKRAGEFWIIITLITVGSKQRTSPIFRSGTFVPLSNGLVIKCHLNTGQPNHWNTRQMDTILFSYVLFQYLNGRSST